MGRSATFDVDAIVRVLGDSVAVLESADIPYVAIGSLAADVWGDVRWARRNVDIDFMIRSADVPTALAAFESSGFESSRPPEDWLVKVHRDDVLVDLIFRAAGYLELDGEMLARGAERAIEGCPLRVVSPEDFVLMQALTTSRETPDHLFNGSSVVRCTPLDWAYLLKRCAGREARVLSLLAHALSEGASVPGDVLQMLVERAAPSRRSGAA